MSPSCSDPHCQSCGGDVDLSGLYVLKATRPDGSFTHTIMDGSTGKPADIPPVLQEFMSNLNSD